MWKQISQCSRRSLVLAPKMLIFFFICDLLRIFKLQFPPSNFWTFLRPWTASRATGTPWPRNRHIEKYLHTWVDYQSVAGWKIVFPPLHVAPILETFNLGLRFFTPQRRKEGSSMEKKLIRFRSMTTLLWPISQRVRISPRTSYDQKLAHAE